ncbi:MAG: phosphoethanolamine transferase [Rhizobacter sp.]
MPLIRPPSIDATQAPRRGMARLSWTLPTEAVVLLVSLFFVLVSNRSFWVTAMSGRTSGDPGSWLFGVCAFLLLLALHFVLLSLVATCRTVRPLLTVLLLGTAAASYFMGRYSVFLDPTMLRNLLHTDTAEARDLLAWDMLPYLLLQALLPIWLLWRTRISDRPWRSAALWRLGSVVGGLLIGVAALLTVSQDLSSLMREQKALRYLVTPANYVYSLVRVATADAVGATRPLTQIGLDAVRGPTWSRHKKPLLFIVVVGETARAVNWGLNGYARQTTPELARLNVVNFTDVGSCGTNTETSLPCMFSRIGRRDYDETRIRGEESLLHVLNHAGFDVQWRDNQSGCKGICAGLPSLNLAKSNDASLCDGQECLDEILLQGLDTQVASGQGNRVIVLHQMGSHGPAYHRRSPPAFQQFKPTCDTSELRKCTTQQVINSYDNSLLYTDHVLAQTIAFLKSQSERYDTAMIYVSDHGESLGENNLFLHGMPYAIAPKEQTHVPMVMWLSDAYASSRSIDLGCLRSRAGQHASHDDLFHTVLGMLDVQTTVYEPALDVLRTCRTAAP